MKSINEVIVLTIIIMIVVFLVVVLGGEMFNQSHIRLEFMEQYNAIKEVIGQ